VPLIFYLGPDGKPAREKIKTNPKKTTAITVYNGGNTDNHGWPLLRGDRPDDP
jgi:hypothetical protein